MKDDKSYKRHFGMEIRLLLGTTCFYLLIAIQQKEMEIFTSQSPMIAEK